MIATIGQILQVLRENPELAKEITSARVFRGNRNHQYSVFPGGSSLYLNFNDYRSRPIVEAVLIEYSDGDEEILGKISSDDGSPAWDLRHELERKLMEKFGQYELGRNERYW